MPVPCFAVSKNLIFFWIFVIYPDRKNNAYIFFGFMSCSFLEYWRVGRDTGEASSEYGEHFLCNTYKTLAIQHPQKEEQVSEHRKMTKRIYVSFGRG